MNKTNSQSMNQTPDNFCFPHILFLFISLHVGRNESYRTVKPCNINFSVSPTLDHSISQEMDHGSSTSLLIYRKLNFYKVAWHAHIACSSVIEFELLMVCVCLYCRYPAEKSSRAAGTAGKTRTSGQWCRHDLVSPHRCGIQWLWGRIWARGQWLVWLKQY